MCNILELAELFVCHGEGDLLSFFSAWGNGKIDGLRFARGKLAPKVTL